MTKNLKLTELQAKIISNIELRPDLTLQQIAKLTRSRHSTVAYNIARLKQNGVIRRTLVINPYVLGLSYVALFFSARFKGTDRRKDLIKRLSASDKVVWLGALAGEFQFGLTVILKELHELQDLLGPILDATGAELTEKLVAPRQRFTFLSRSWSGGSTAARQSITVAPLPNQIYEQLDLLDQRLLFTLSKDAELSGREIAKELGAPISTVERRLQLLSQRGIISGVRYSVNGDKLGLNSYRILLSLPGISSRDRAVLFDFALKNSVVQGFIESFGAWDYELLVETKTAEELRSFLENLMDSSGVNIQKVTVLSELDDLKFSPWPIISGKSRQVK